MNWLKLGVPLLLGVAAAAINWTAMSAGGDVFESVRVREAVPKGKPFSEDVLERFEMRGDAGSFKNTLVPYAGRKILINRVAMRDMKAGDVVFFRDALPPAPVPELAEDEAELPISLDGVSLPPQRIEVGDQVEFILAVPPRLDAKGEGRARETFEIAGPFRVVSLGDIVNRRPNDEATEEPDTRPSQQRNITVAEKRVAGRLSPEIEKLVRARHDEKGGQRRIVEIVLKPKRRAASK